MTGLFKCRQCGKEFMRNGVWDPVDCPECMAEMGRKMMKLLEYKWSEGNKDDQTMGK